MAETEPEPIVEKHEFMLVAHTVIRSLEEKINELNENLNGVLEVTNDTIFFNDLGYKVIYYANKDTGYLGYELQEKDKTGYLSESRGTE